MQTLYAMKYFSILVFTLGFHLAASGQALVVGMEPDASFFQFLKAGHLEPAPMFDSMELFPGDMIFCGSDEGILELQCPFGDANTIYIDSQGVFIVQQPIVNGSIVECSFYIHSGEINVLSETPTHVSSNLASGSSVGTEFAVRVDGSDTGAVTRFEVYDGKLKVESKGRGTEVVQAGFKRKATYNGIQAEQKISAQLFDAKATQRARWQYAAASRKGRTDLNEETFQQLKQANLATMQAPDDENARANLAITQDAMGLYTNAEYNFKRAGITTAADFEKVDAEIVTTAPITVETTTRYTVDRREEKEKEKNLKELLSKEIGELNSSEQYQCALYYAKQGNYSRAQYYAKSAYSYNRRDRMLSDKEVENIKRMMEKY